MKLNKLIDIENLLDVKGSLDIEITDVVYDSRKAKDGCVFVAIEGFKVDGHNFTEEVIKKGARAIIVQRDIDLEENITVIKVKSTRLALAEISSNFYQNPSSKLSLIGVTGTNAKTTTTYLIQSILENVDKKTGIVGTIGNIINGKLFKTNNTTPESLELQKTFSNMVESKVDNCIMEVSSHALDLNRVSYCDFETGIFTNLSVDHLDYHKTLENYLDAKIKLFYMTKKYNIINADDEYGKRIIEKIKNIDTPLLTYGIENKCDIYATDIVYHLNGVEFRLNTPKGSIDIKMNIPGEFSVYNALTAASCGYAYDLSLEDIKVGLESVKGVKGRFEVVDTDRDFVVIIDFAHTPDALEKALKSIKEFAKRRLVVLFGAGGDRDNSKRATMGEIAGKYADFSIVTSDNPRSEDPTKIIEDILIGTKKSTENYIAITDRKEAIKYAIENSKTNDIILLAGKGHETYTIIGEKTLPFDEREIVKEILAETELKR
ncbi:UDP-N-acetylmuramoyl-L-alanyl-D-glutamate--2,6-diaminopimelate ligase MurE [Gottschalkia acidurici 9a]|uniref:UDP-N-acetylmuramoyl-L-alanyl-D-glutamate--2,6-diaminopimelate ligase n=1 Tax=Gottschalkia acidurici (strain ATCC 7906 / DSM 604 / BCRC 14475 / CIP 104303 / KCTC 5404 / NCIMB 10678 / 9a) TaxID=1128398 RepID=K0AWW5_GOTA9|nr:UDP-N-acetylmuramoyl-L-alanyl-D-glutamate--2,6-diaminopimelate ligase [Gottschalkia acidurici]AFS78308.1 UDP-N-acetylmuramoyl-L-alanyl-D-glutamate--2,6-diaminopimelate ligase MurE [Gottschalkia acidurici 9a]